MKIMTENERMAALIGVECGWIGILAGFTMGWVVEIVHKFNQSLSVELLILLFIVLVTHFTMKICVKKAKEIMADKE